MKVYRFSRETREFLKEDIANKNPRNPNNPILPGFCCWDAPPETKEGEIAVRDQNNKFWMVKKDNRGKKFYLKDSGVECNIIAIDTEMPEEGIELAPPKDFIQPKYDVDKWIDTAPTLEDVINESPINIDDALEEMFEIIKGDKLPPVDFDSFKKDVISRSKFKNLDNLKTKVKKEDFNDKFIR